MNKTEYESNTSTLSANSLMRSHSHSNVNKPSQDLLGLTLHEISDPIDAPEVSKSNNSELQESQCQDNMNETNEFEKQSNMTSQESGASYNTSKGWYSLS